MNTALLFSFGWLKSSSLISVQIEITIYDLRI